MKFLMTYAGDPQNPPPSPEKLQKLGQFTAEGLKSGVVLLTGGLVRPTTGTKVRMKTGQFSVTDAPLPEAKELIDGFALIQAGSKDEAVAIARRFMEIAGDGDGEILQVFDPGGPSR